MATMLSAASPPLQQSPEFAAALRAIGRPPLPLPDGTLALRRRICGLPVTMLARSRPCPNALPDLLKEAGLQNTLLVLSPDDPTRDLAHLGAVPVMSPATLAELDLTGDLRANLRGKWRNRLVHAEKQNLRVTRQNMPLDPAHWLFKEATAQQRQRGYRSWPTDLTLAYARENPGQAKLFTAFAGKTPVAAMLFLCHGRAATYHIGHTTARGRHHSAHTLLMWEAMRWLARKGHHRLDLGLISTEDAPGLARFKLGTGAQARPLGGTWLWWPRLGKTLRPLAALDARLMQSGWTDTPSVDYLNTRSYRGKRKPPCSSTPHPQ
ncbi:MAG: GNAT family N-acetyltransferase [Ruegeria sp.]